MSNQATICKGCWQQMHVPVPLRGLASLPFRAFGIRPISRRKLWNGPIECELLRYDLYARTPAAERPPTDE